MLNLFIVAALLDLGTFTMYISQHGWEGISQIEVNKIALVVLEHFGLPGLFVFKAASTLAALAMARILIQKVGKRGTRFGLGVCFFINVVGLCTNLIELLA